MAGLPEGTEIGGWVVVRTLGEGGMGAVYLCRNPLSDRMQAAVKVLKPHGLEQGRERFIREMEALAALSHRAVVRVLGSGHDTDRDLLWMAMEYLEGMTLEDRIDRGAMPWEDAVRLVREVAAGLSHAHDSGIRHRDVKPANVFLCSDGAVKVLDFGIAVQAGRTRLTTDQSTIPGTIAYIPPEVFTGLSPDPVLTDVYATGLLLYEAIVGDRAFPEDPGMSSGQRMARIMAKKLSGAPMDPGPDVPQAVRDLVRWATDAEPTRRMSDMQLFVSGCDVILGGSVDELPPLANREGVYVDLPPSDGTRYSSDTVDLSALFDEADLPEEPAHTEERSPLLRVAMWLVLLVALGAGGGVAMMLVLSASDTEADPIGPDEETVVIPRDGPGQILAVYEYPMVRVEPGDFWMGSGPGQKGRYGDEKRHPVQLTRPVLVGAYEVHQELYQAVMSRNPSVSGEQRILDGKTGDGDACKGWGTDPRMPVFCVSWFDVITFANKLSLLENLEPAYGTRGGVVVWNPDANGYRLPTEAEWEYLAGGPSGQTYAGTNELAEVCRFGNVANLATKKKHYAWMTWKALDCDDPAVDLTTIGSLEANGFGLYDLTGNVREWVWDAYGPFPEETAIDPTGADATTVQAEDQRRIYKGGSWADRARRIRNATRRNAPPGTREVTLGFRIVRNAE